MEHRESHFLYPIKGARVQLCLGSGAMSEASRPPRGQALRNTMERSRREE